MCISIHYLIFPGIRLQHYVLLLGGLQLEKSHICIYCECYQTLVALKHLVTCNASVCVCVSMYTCSVHVCDLRFDRKVEGKFNSVKLISVHTLYVHVWYINIVCWDCCTVRCIMYACMYDESIL